MIKRFGLPIPTMAIGSGHCDGEGSFPNTLAVPGNPDVWEVLTGTSVSILNKTTDIPANFLE